MTKYRPQIGLSGPSVAAKCHFSFAPAEKIISCGDITLMKVTCHSRQVSRFFSHYCSLLLQRKGVIHQMQITEMYVQHMVCMLITHNMQQNSRYKSNSKLIPG